MLKHMHIIAMLTDYKSGDFHLNGYHIVIEYLVSSGISNRSKCHYASIETIETAYVL